MMTGFGFQITVNDQDIQDLFRRFMRAGRDPAPLLDDLGEDMENLVRLNWEEGKDPYNNSWEELSPATKRRRRKGRGTGSSQILRDSGRLMNSVTHQATGNAVEVGTDVEYGPVHQTGGKHVPKRSFLPDEEKGLPGEWREAIEDRIADHFRRLS